MKNSWGYIDHKDVSGSYGLAVDEYLTDIHKQVNKAQHPAYLRLYNYKNYNVLSGRFQNISAEIDIDICNELGFGFGRRLTGGGAILMGEDQLGICFATDQREFPWEHISDLYKQLSEPIIHALQELGIEATFRSKNDLEVNGKKIAGLGVYISPSGGIQFHTSLLLDLDIETMLKVLKIPIQKYSDKRKIASVRQRITSINMELGRKIELAEVKSLIIQKFEERFGKYFEPYVLTAEEEEEVLKIEANRYKNEDWIFQRSPQEDMTGTSLKKTSAGLLRTYIGLKGENIKSVLITGDFMDKQDILLELESELKWSALDKEKITKVVESVLSKHKNDASTSKQITTDELVDAIWIAAQRALAEKRYTYNGSCYYPKMDKASAAGIIKEVQNIELE